ncbi:MAG: DUF349 domain-containing protein [Gammaproteobacteria bacterium]|nr:DUF349 domain-containing protein [Gammaproteobacteria bacterium]
MTQERSLLNKLLNPLISPFSKDKWQSRNPEVRKKAVQDLAVSDQETLSQIAMNDSDESIRAIAANKLSNLDLLQTIIMKGTNGTVKEAAQNRLFQLICGLKHPIPDYDVREKMIRGSRNSALLEFVAANADDASLREITIKKISRDPLLGDIALMDENPHIRQLAAQQIAKRSTLERVTKKSRRKDKRVYKIVKTKLDRILEDEQRPALLAKEVVDICIKLEKLHKRNLLLQEKITFENYVTRWSEIQNFADPETTERYHKICSSIINEMDELELELQKEQNAKQDLETLLSSLTNAVDDLLNAKENKSPENNEISETDKEIIKIAEKKILNLGLEWDEVIKLISHDELITDFNAKFQSILDLADASAGQENIKSKNTNDNGFKKLQTLSEQAENMLNKTGFILEKTISALELKFNQQVQSINQQTDNLPEEITLCKNKFESAILTIKERLQVQQNQAKKFKETITLNTEKINTLISNGHVSKAERQLKEQLKQIDKSELISKIEKQKFQDDLNKIHSQLDDLSSWRNWAHDNERENLAIKAEKLAEQVSQSDELANEYTDITSQIKEFRSQWKSMRSHTQEELWTRFNTACNLAYEKCKPFIDKQNEVRKDNFKAKQNLCEQLEDYIKKMAWPSSEDTEIDHSIDWIQVDKITKQARKEWGTIGFVDRKQHKAISHRFDQAIEIIRNELKKVWQFNQDKFFNLIQTVEQLPEIIDDDLTGAINKAKDCQKQWKQIGPVSSYQRNKLWKRFRKACDVIFNKRQETIEQKNVANTEHLREKEAICENLEALNQQPLNQNDLENAFADIESLWLELSPKANQISKEVNKRYSTALSAYHDKIKSLIIEQQELYLNQLTQQANLCSEIESNSDGNDESINKYREHWIEITKETPNKYQLNNRFENAIASISDDKTPLIQSELDEKNQFCLKYEILLGKESPSEDQQSRMEMQVELLNSNLGQNRRDEAEEKQVTSFELQHHWYEISNYSQDKTSEARFMKLISD